MSSRVQNNPAGEHTAGSYEVIDLGYGRLDNAGPVVEIEPLEVIEPTANPRRVHGPDPDTAYAPRRIGLVLALTFVFGLATGVVAMQAHSDTEPAVPVALELGSATPDRAVVQLSASFGVTAVAVPVHNAGSEDVTLHGFSLPGWHQDQIDSAQEPVTVPAGLTRTATTGANLDCAQPRPITPTVAEVRVRTNDLGVISMTVPLSQPARELTARWEQFCASAP